MVERAMLIAEAVHEYLKELSTTHKSTRLDWYLVLLKGIGQLASQLIEQEVPEESVGKLIGLVRAWKDLERVDIYTIHCTYSKDTSMGLLFLVMRSIDTVGVAVEDDENGTRLARHLEELESHLIQYLFTYEGR